MTARSRRECVYAPMNLVSLRMMMGSAQPNSADTAGGSTPEMIAKDPEDCLDHVSRNGTKAVSCSEPVRTQGVGREEHD